MRLLCASAMAAAIGAAALGATPAAADDDAWGPFGKKYPWTWQGAYAGVHAGLAEGDFVGGVQVGYNWQKGRMVYGVEGDFSLTTIDESFAGISSSVDWLATVRGRVGYLVDPNILAYATAGLGIGHGSVEIAGLGGVSDTDTDTVLGFGVEAKINETMSGRLELLTFDDFNVDIIRAGVNFKFGR